MAKYKNEYNFRNKVIGDYVDFGQFGVKKWNGRVWEKDLSASDEALPKSGGTMTGPIASIKEVKQELTDNNIDLNLGNLFTKVITENTVFTISNASPSGTVNSFILELTNAGSKTITWFSGVKWDGGTVPSLSASGVDILGFYSHDEGITWRGLVLSKDSK